jgi:hypothetical protein
MAVVLVGFAVGDIATASMTLLGDRNWHLPRWLNGLPGISAEE